MEEKERYKYLKETNQLYDSEEDELYAYNLNNNKIISILNQQAKRIKELKSKLRVSNSLNASVSLDYNELKKQYDSQEKLLTRKLAENSRLTLENQQLKHKLAEKEKEIDDFKRIGEKGHLDLLEDKRKENRILIKVSEQLLQSQKQLAIKQLQKLKESILKIDKTEIKTLGNGYSTLYVDRPEIINEIDNQIKELKGENAK